MFYGIGSLCRRGSARCRRSVIPENAAGPVAAGSPDQFRQAILTLISDHYSDFGPTLASENLLERHGIEVSGGIKLILWSISMRPKFQAQRINRQVFWLSLAVAVICGLYVRGGRNFAGALILAGIIVFAIAFVRLSTSIWHRRPNFASFVNAAYLELAKALLSAALAIDLIVGMFYLAGYGVIDKSNDAIEATWVVLFFFFGGMSIIFFACFLGTLAFICIHRR